MSSTYPFNQPSNFVDLLHSQQETVATYPNPFPSLELPAFSTQTSPEDQGAFDDEPTKEPAHRRERRSWSPADDTLLISAWLNTSKDPVIGNEQKLGAFWDRIATYYAASHTSGDVRGPGQCKKRWHKINDLVCKFVGAYDTATRAKGSGHNETDVLKQAHAIFYKDHNKKFILEHCWKELRNDQKWCETLTTQTDGPCKWRKADNGGPSEVDGNKDAEADQANIRPPGVKAAKAKGKKASMVEGKSLNEFSSMWAVKERDMVLKKEITAMGLLDSIFAKKEPLTATEEALKQKLINQLLGN
ncbi:glutathione S-transferase T3-like [Eutrema salsugineum]|uniref:glutathione S-transferase T3-like n=1 Tax=Eutrema salsugineum TaxID=72664 RepID=UPI000CED5B48|nr:glutathione S-transferase T3-like [Eutrema salsugineum]